MKHKRVRIIKREEWGAIVERSAFTPLPATAVRLWIHHMGAAWHRPPTWTERNFRTGQARYLREIESYHLSKGWSGIAYSLVEFRSMFGRTVVYEGRGVDVIGAHTYGDNSKSIAISFVGDYTSQTPGRAMLLKGRRLIDQLVREGDLDGKRATFPTGGHRDAPGAATACPGANLEAKIKELRRSA